MTNYISLEERKIRGIVVIECTNKSIFSVGKNNIVSIEVIDLENFVYLVNYEDGESELFRKVTTVLYYK